MLNENNKLTYKVNDKFLVSKFLTLLPIDFIYSTDINEDKYLLLNQQMLGEFTNLDIDQQQRKGRRVVTLNNDTLEMISYNIPEDEMIDALMKM